MNYEKGDTMGNKMKESNVETKIINIKIKIGEIEFECSGNFSDVYYQKKDFIKNLPIFVKVLKKEELNEKDFDSDIKQLMELSIKKLNLSKQIVKDLEDNHINCIEDLLDTENLESTLHDEAEAEKIDKVLKEFGLYRGMKYSQIELPESIIAEINLKYE